jgi:predicted transcriptional regulator
MAVQVTSLISYYEVLNTLSRRHKEVLLAMKHLGIANNLMVSRCLNLPINSVTPRMNELRHKGIVIYYDTHACPITKRSTRFFIIKGWIRESMG